MRREGRRRAEASGDGRGRAAGDGRARQETGGGARRRAWTNQFVVDIGDVALCVHEHMAVEEPRVGRIVRLETKVAEII